MCDYIREIAGGPGSGPDADKPSLRECLAEVEQALANPVVASP
jgi:hypothetical protein